MTISRHPLRTIIRRPSAFTLVELLIAVAIIGILSLLFIGGLQVARSRANEAKCTSNLRQLGAGAMAYIHDRNGVLLPTKVFYSASFEKNGGFRDYVGFEFPGKTSAAPAMYNVDSVFTCPELKLKQAGKFSPPTLFNRTYTMNEFAMASEDDVQKDGGVYPKRLNRIPLLSKMIFLMDGSALKEGKNFHTTLNPSYVERDFLYYPHAKRQNVLFFDGHVAKLSEEELKTPVNPKHLWGDLSP